MRKIGHGRYRHCARPARILTRTGFSLSLKASLRYDLSVDLHGQQLAGLHGSDEVSGFARYTWSQVSPSLAKNLRRRQAL